MNQGLNSVPPVNSSQIVLMKIHVQLDSCLYHICLSKISILRCEDSCYLHAILLRLPEFVFMVGSNLLNERLA